MLVPFRGRGATSALVFALLTGCGGKVVFEESGAGGTGSTTVGSSKAVTIGVGTSTGSPGQCPAEDPIAGTACTMPGLVCPLPNQCCNPAARCENGKWSISAPDCASPCLPCGMQLECAISSVCVETQVDANEIFRCDANPCTPSPLSCGCAKSVCIGGGAMCKTTNASTVFCDTLTD